MPNYIITTIFIPAIKEMITFYIGKNAIGNFEIIDLSKPTDIWFHVSDKPSCHVIASIPNKIKSNELKHIIKVGNMLCKKNTKDNHNIMIIHTYVKNITKTNIIGCVNINSII